MLVAVSLDPYQAAHGPPLRLPLETLRTSPGGEVVEVEERLSGDATAAGAARRRQ